MIPPLKPSSCQLIVFVVYENKFSFVLEDLVDGEYDVGLVKVEFRKLGLSSVEIVNEGKVKIKVGLDDEEVRLDEIT